MNDTLLEELIQQSRTGDLRAFEKIINMHKNFSISVAWRFFGNEEEVEDIVQETFIRIWKYLPRFDFRCKFTTWMYRIIVNICLDRIKYENRKRKNLGHQEDASLIEYLPGGSDPEEEGIKRNLASIITQLAKKLTPKQRSVFILRDLQDLNLEEVSQILNISIGSVKSNLYYARNRIRKWVIPVEYNNGRKT